MGIVVSIHNNREIYGKISNVINTGAILLKYGNLDTKVFVSTYMH